MNILNIKTFTLVVILIFSKLTFSQGEDRTINQANSSKLLQIRPNMQFGILPEYIGDLMVQTNIDAQYWYKNKFDLRANLMSGSYTGFLLGGTLHIKDNMVNKSQKFIVSVTESNNVRTTEYYKRNCDVRKIFGPTADLSLTFTNFGNKDKIQGTVTQIRGGIDLQTFSRAYLLKDGSTYGSNKNGWYSLKFMAIAQIYSATNLSNQKISATQFGGLGSLTAVRAPWKTISFSLNLDLGATFGNGEVTPIITPGFGLSINLIKSKEPIDY